MILLTFNMIKEYIILIISVYLKITLFACDKYDLKQSIENKNAIALEHGGIMREYILYVPESYSEDLPVPLMMNFHGGSGTATGHLYISDMRSIADTANFILVYPQGSVLDGGTTHWNSMPPSDDNKSSADDFGFIDTLIDEISSNYNIDSTRIYASGFSNGGDFSYSLACYLSNRIAAIAPVAGLMMESPPENCNPTHPTGVMIIHGTSDGSRPYNGIAGYYASIDETVDYWSNYNNTLDNPILYNYNSGDLNINLYNYFNSDSVNYLKLFKVINGGHYWLNISDGSFSTDQIIWNFVSKFSNNSLR